MKYDLLRYMSIHTRAFVLPGYGTRGPGTMSDLEDVLPPSSPTERTPHKTQSEIHSEFLQLWDSFNCFFFCLPARTIHLADKQRSEMYAE